MSFTNCGKRNSKTREISAYVSKPTLDFDNLQISDAPYYSNQIVGCVVQCYPEHKYKQSVKRRKVVLKECDKDGTLRVKEISLFLYDTFVDFAKDVRDGDYITASGFEVTINTCFDSDNPSNMYPYVIELIGNNNSNENTPAACITKMPVFQFDNLEMNDKVYNGICLVGHIHEFVKIQKDYLKRLFLKVVLREVLNDGSLGDIYLDCLIYDNLAKKYKDLNEGDTIQISSFKVEARPSTSDEYLMFYAYRIILLQHNGVIPTVKVIKSATEKHTREKSVKEHSTKQQSSYQYTLLNELKMDVRNGYNAKQQFHIFGVVVKASLHTFTYKECLEVQIRDQTMDRFVVFVSQNNTAKDFPEVHPYDIIRFHRVILEFNRNELQGQCPSPNNVLVFSGTDPYAEPVHTSRNFTLTNSDKRRVVLLHTWSKLPNGSKRNLNKPAVVIDLTDSSVLEHCVLQNNEAEKVVEHSREKREESKHNHQPTESEHLSSLTDIVSVDIATHLDIRVANEIHQEREIQTQNVLQKDNSRLHVTGNHLVDNSKILSHACISDSVADETVDNEIDNELSDVSGIVENQYEFDPKVIYKDFVDTMKIVSVPIGMESAPITKISDINHTPVWSRVRVRARVVDMKPEPINANECIYLLCNHCQYFILKRDATDFTFIKQDKGHVFLCPNCLQSEQKCSPLDCCFFLGIQLDDGTGRVDAYLYQEQATFFFQGISAQQCCSDNILYFKFVISKLFEISSFPNSKSNPPVLDCCLFKQESATGQRYRIVDTKLL